MTQPPLHSFAIGLATKNQKGEIIEIFYPAPVITPAPEVAGLLRKVFRLEQLDNISVAPDHEQLTALQSGLADLDLARQADLLRQLADAEPVVCVIQEDRPPATIAEVFLKLHLLSHRLALPNSLNLQGAFGVLRNLAWTNRGPVQLDELASRQLQSRLAGELLEVMSVDKFPKMSNYVVPPGVRIAHTARVRLGAYLGEGTTVMHEGFVNFNAGSAGKAMVEGRISASVMVGQGSDLGGGCSIMGTLSGGGTEVISVGENCLIGANAGIGFSLGDRCIVEAGLYVTAGTKVRVMDRNGELQDTVKARDLSRKNDLLFRRNSLSGAVECVPNKASIALNEDLHSHN